jgi:DNA helicase-2/ATP-dependent DNA helicase PcrA
MMRWSKFQKDIFKNVKSGRGHCIVNATAGSGKTSTLIESLNHLPEDKTALLVAFNKKIAEELLKRAPANSNLDIRTLHSLGLRTIFSRFSNTKVDSNKLRHILDKVIGRDRSLWDLKFQVAKTINLCKGYLVDGKEFVDHIMDNHDIDTCSINRDTFIGYVQKGMKASRESMRSVDFADMVWIPYVYNITPKQYDRVFIDEAQDLNGAQVALALSACKPDGRIMALGDENQCVDQSTIVETVDGHKSILDLSVGDEVLSYHNGKNTFKKILNKSESMCSSGLEITTTSGKKLLMSPNHKIYAALPELKENQKIIYLMYRKDLGFRIGKTNKLKSAKNPFGARTRSEYADKLWILDMVESEEEALLQEELLSLEYGIPTAVFNGTKRGLNQERIVEIFKKFGHKGQDILDDRGLSFVYSHWTGCSKTGRNGSSKRRRVYVRSHTVKNYTEVSFEWTDPAITKQIENAGTHYTNGSNRHTGSNFRVRRCIKKYTEALIFAQKLASITDSYLYESLSYKKMRAQLITASGLFVGSTVFINRDGRLNHEQIVSIAKKHGRFFDIEVEGTANFYGNDILSHNCLYNFSGTSLHSMSNLQKKLDAKCLPLSITYRCPKLVVKEANEFDPDMQAAPGAKDGVVETITKAKMLKMAKPGCFIISRLNAPLMSLALGFIKKGTPAIIQGRDVGQNLLVLIKKSRKKNIDTFATWLDAWEKKEIARLRKKKANFEHVKDKAECLRALIESCKDMKEVKHKIKTMFEDTDDYGKVVLTSTHKCKGMERDTVFMLMKTFRSFDKSERNIKFVALTRSKENLYLVEG